jgi:hypothetical protein
VCWNRRLLQILCSAGCREFDVCVHLLLFAVANMFSEAFAVRPVRSWGQVDFPITDETNSPTSEKKTRSKGTAQSVAFCRKSMESGLLDFPAWSTSIRVSIAMIFGTCAEDIADKGLGHSSRMTLLRMKKDSIVLKSRIAPTQQAMRLLLLMNARSAALLE